MGLSLPDNKEVVKELKDTHSTIKEEARGAKIEARLAILIALASFVLTVLSYL